MAYDLEKKAINYFSTKVISSKLDGKGIPPRLYLNEVINGKCFF